MRSKAQVIVLDVSFVAKAIKAKCKADSARDYFPQPDECASNTYEWGRLCNASEAAAKAFDFLDELAEALLDEEPIIARPKDEEDQHLLGCVSES